MNYLLIWDIDGTLIQGCHIGRRAMDMAFLDLYGIPEGFKEINMAGSLDAIILKQGYELHHLIGKDPNEFFERYCEYLSGEMKKLKSSVCAPGIIHLLEELGNIGGFFNVLGTGNIEKGARIKLSMHDLNRFFPTGGFGSEVMERWQVIEKAIEKSNSYFNTNFEKAATFVIGDTPKDIACGKILGLKSIGVATGSFTFAELQDCGADYVFEDLTNIDKFLKLFK